MGSSVEPGLPKIVVRPCARNSSSASSLTVVPDGPAPLRCASPPDGPAPLRCASVVTPEGLPPSATAHQRRSPDLLDRRRGQVQPAHADDHVAEVVLVEAPAQLLRAG